VQASVSHAADPAQARLDITRDGQSYDDEPIRSRFCGADCTVTGVSGHSPVAVDDLAADARAHRLHSALGPPHGSQTAFVTELRRLLLRLGYTR